MSRKVKIISGIIFIAALAALGLFFLRARQKSVTEEVVVKVLEGGTAPTESEIAEKLTGKDIFAEQGVKLQKIPGSATAGWNSPMALLAGKIDVGGGSLAGWINIRARGGKIKAVIPGGVVSPDYHAGILVLADSDIRSVKDLAGKTVTVNTLGLGGEFHLKLLLKRNGVPLDQVQVLATPTENEIQLLLSKQVNAVADTLDGSIFIDLALDRGGVRLLPDTSVYAIHGECARTPSGFREDFIQAHPETVRGYVTAAEKIRRLIWEAFKKDPEQIRKAYVEIAERKGGNPKLAKYFRPTPPGIFMTDRDVQWWIDAMISEGKLKPGQVKPADVYTNEFNPYYKDYQSSQATAARADN
jgi:ABC-type nitrate/sulfonate/bicarbonate transport system substrate-binding protein